MEELLIDAGLTKLQAQTYLYLLEHGATLPGQLTSKLKITRTNTYKVLDSLEKLGLVSKDANDKKLRYSTEDPIALTSLVAEKRNNIIALEKNVDNAMRQLRKNFSRSQSSSKVRNSTGKTAIEKEYLQQAEQKQPIYFIKTRADIPFLGFEAMDAIRVAQGKLSPARYGITPDSPEAAINVAIDNRTKLTRTWLDESDYTAPVEWSVSGDSLIIQVFDDEGRTITIQDPLVAESFRQLWQLLDRTLRSSPSYETLPRKARRTV